MKQRSKWFGLGLAFASLAVVTTTGLAGTKTFDFETNPTNEGIQFFGNSEWVQSGGNPGGFLVVTRAIDSQKSVLVFPDIDNGFPVRAFTFEADIRCGGGEDPPADGFSMSYARDTDPVVLAPATGAFAGSPSGAETNLPEEGTQTGLAIGFDEWESGAPDVRGFSVRVDNVVLQEIALPTTDGALDDITSLQTGPRNPDVDPSDLSGPTSWALLGWAKFKVELNELGQVSLWWKGNQFLNNYQTAFFPSAGRLVFAGRTGANNGNQHFDNMVLTTVAATNFFITGLTGRADGASVRITDIGTTSVVQPQTIKMTLNGTPAPAGAVTISKQGPFSTATYSLAPNFLAAGSTNTITIEAQDNNGITASETREFIVRPYIVLDPEWIAPAGTYDTASRGFKGSINQIGVGRSPGDGTSTWNALRQLAGGFIDPVTGNTYPNLVDPTAGVDANGNFEMPDTVGNYPSPWININQDFYSTTAAEVGSFQSPDFPDDPIPGIVPESETVFNSDNIVMEAYTYLQLGGPNGKFYTFGVNSDDGFHVAFGPETRSALFTAAGGASTSTYASQYNGGKGASDVTFDVVVPQGATGVYRARLVWWEGGGGANCEFFQVLDDGTKVLLGDPDSVPNYRASGTGQSHIADIVSAAPWPGQTGIRPDTQIQVILADGTGATVDGNSITVSVNGVEFAKTVTKTGDKTRVTATPDGLLDSGAVNDVSVTWTAGGNTRTDTWSFTTLAYTTLPEWLARPLGSGSNPGFTARVHQLGTLQAAADIASIGNRWHIRDQQLAGLFGPSTATVAATADQVLSTINFNGDDPLANIANFTGDVSIPGIPGTKADRATDDIAMEIITYIEIPTAGYYQMGVFSDDGFNVIAREKLNRLPGLKILSPASLFAGQNNHVGAISRGGTQGRYVAAPLPTTAVEGKIVAAVPAIADTALQNAAEIAGNIALIDRGTVSFAIKIANAADAGAIGVIMVDSNTDGRLPIEMSATENSTLPAVMVSNTDGATLKTALAGGEVRASIGADTIPSLGFFNDGRGWDDGDGPSLFGFQVTKPGLYPFRMVWFEGGGGANCEWFFQSPSGARVLINDPANATVGLKAFRNAPPVVEPTEAEFNPPTIAGGQVTLTWTGAGTLQESANLIDWTAVDSQPAGQTFTVTPDGANPNKFYRILVQP